MAHGTGATATVTNFAKSVGSAYSEAVSFLNPVLGLQGLSEYDTRCGTYDNTKQYSLKCPSVSYSGAVSFSGGKVTIEAFLGKAHSAATDTFTVTIRHDVEGSYQLLDNGNLIKDVELSGAKADALFTGMTNVVLRYGHKSDATTRLDKDFYTLAVDSNENRTVYTFTATNAGQGSVKVNDVAGVGPFYLGNNGKPAQADNADKMVDPELSSCSLGRVLFVSGASFRKIGRDLPAGAISVMSSTGDGTTAVNSTKRTSKYGAFSSASVELTTSAGRGIGNITWKWAQPETVDISEGVSRNWDGIIKLPMGYVKFEHGYHCYGYTSGGTEHTNRVYQDSIESLVMYSNQLSFTGFSKLTSGDAMVVTCDGARNPFSMPVNRTVGLFSFRKQTVVENTDAGCASSTDDEGASSTDDGKAGSAIIEDYVKQQIYTHYVNFPAVSQYTFSAASGIEVGFVTVLLLCFQYVFN